MTTVVQVSTDYRIEKAAWMLIDGVAENAQGDVHDVAATNGVI